MSDIHEDVMKALRDDGLSEQYPDEVKADKWRNLWFLSDGTTDLGMFIGSQAECEEVKRFALNWHGVNILESGRRFYPSEMLFAIPMPVKS